MFRLFQCHSFGLGLAPSSGSSSSSGERSPLRQATKETQLATVEVSRRLFHLLTVFQVRGFLLGMFFWICQTQIVFFQLKVPIKQFDFDNYTIPADAVIKIPLQELYCSKNLFPDGCIFASVRRLNSIYRIRKGVKSYKNLACMDTACLVRTLFLFFLALSCLWKKPL